MKTSSMSNPDETRGLDPVARAKARTRMGKRIPYTRVAQDPRLNIVACANNGEPITVQVFREMSPEEKRDNPKMD